MAGYLTVCATPMPHCETCDHIMRPQFTISPGTHPTDTCGSLRLGFLTVTVPERDSENLGLTVTISSCESSVLTANPAASSNRALGHNLPVQQEIIGLRNHHWHSTWSHLCISKKINNFSVIIFHVFQLFLS